MREGQAVRTAKLSVISRAGILRMLGSPARQMVSDLESGRNWPGKVCIGAYASLADDTLVPVNVGAAPMTAEVKAKRNKKCRSLQCNCFQETSLATVLHSEKFTSPTAELHRRNLLNF